MSVHFFTIQTPSISARTSQEFSVSIYRSPDTPTLTECCWKNILIMMWSVPGERWLGPASRCLWLLHRHGRHVQHLFNLQPGGHQYWQVYTMNVIRLRLLLNGHGFHNMKNTYSKELLESEGNIEVKPVKIWTKNGGSTNCLVCESAGPSTSWPHFNLLQLRPPARIISQLATSSAQIKVL